MRLLVADKIDRGPLADLEILGVEVVHDPALTADGLIGALDDVDILVVRSTRVPKEAIERSPSLSLIIRAGAGVNTIDLATASKHGVYVANCPGKNAAAVAELTMGLVLALDRRIVDATIALREGRWEKAEYQTAAGLYGKRIGIAGLGEIGRRVAKRARAFGMVVYAWSRSLTARRASDEGIRHCGSLRELASSVDILSLHLPLDETTNGIVDREVLDAMPEDGMLINTARAEILDYEALAAVMGPKRLRVGLDVYQDEPKAGSARDFLPPVVQQAAASEGALLYGTPHIAASTAQAQRAISREVVRIVRDFMTEVEVPNVVNVCRNTPARWALVLRSRDEVGVLANVLNVIKRHGLNIEEITNTVFDGASAACTKLRLTGRPGENCLNEIRAFDEVFHVDVVQLPNLA
ncbi:MAG: D-3-phosphoglycerate dehydrogenase [Myxococcales bacterium]|nr:D-3-phosphoglycerate dehydrogenase [Myxococcales bacterium]